MGHYTSLNPESLTTGYKTLVKPELRKPRMQFSGVHKSLYESETKLVNSVREYLPLSE